MAEEWVRVASMADLERSNGALKVIVAGRGIALFAKEGTVHAVQNACPHRGAPLAGGQVYRLSDGLFVICPDHAWRFSLENGVCPEAGPECSLLTWDVKVDGGEIFVSRLPRMQ